jgi:glycosyltransferase involved in cell wall biosynthesis
MKKYNILLVSHSSELLGAQQSLLYILKNIDTDRFNPLVICPSKGPLIQEIEKLGFSVEIVPMQWWLFGRFNLLKESVKPIFQLYSIFKILFQIKKYDIDLIHINTIVNFEAAVAAKIAKKPCVWHIREILKDNPGLKSLIGAPRIYKAVYTLSDKIICISKAVKFKFRENIEYNTPKIEIIYNAVDIGKFTGICGDPFRNKIGITQDTFLVGLVGNIEERKGHTDLLYAIKSIAQKNDGIKNLKFAIVGDGDPEYVSKLKHTVKELGIEDYIIFTGFYKEIPVVMAALDLLVLPSWEEPFGRVVIEAMAAGKPVVGTNSGGVPEIIEDGKTGILVPSRDSEAMSEAVDKLLKDRELAQLMGEEGRKRVIKCFTPRAYAIEIEKVYVKVLTGKTK